ATLRNATPSARSLMPWGPLTSCCSRHSNIADAPTLPLTEEKLDGVACVVCEPQARQLSQKGDLPALCRCAARTKQAQTCGTLDKIGPTASSHLERTMVIRPERTR